MPADIPQFSRYLELYSAWTKSPSYGSNTAKTCTPTDLKEACVPASKPSCTKQREEPAEVAAN